MPHASSTRPCVLLVSPRAERYRTAHSALQHIGVPLLLEWARTPVDAWHWIHGRHLKLVLIDMAVNANGRLLVTQIARSHPHLPLLAMSDHLDSPSLGALATRAVWTGLDTSLRHWFAALPPCTAPCFPEIPS